MEKEGGIKRMMLVAGAVKHNSFVGNIEYLKKIFFQRKQVDGWGFLSNSSQGQYYRKSAEWHKNDSHHFILQFPLS